MKIYSSKPIDPTEFLHLFVYRNGSIAGYKGDSNKKKKTHKQQPSQYQYNFVSSSSYKCVLYLTAIINVVCSIVYVLAITATFFD